jgi:FHA domain
MSFRLFVYWCALCGGWAAAAGWLFGRTANGDVLGRAGLRGMYLGLLIALALCVVDALWVFSLRQLRQVLPRVLLCTSVGAVGGLLGGVVGQLLFDWKSWAAFLVFGWGLTGMMVGLSLATYDLLRGWVLEEDLRGARRKVLRGILGGAFGGLVGGILDWELTEGGLSFLPQNDSLWSPSLTGFIVLGLCIGLSIGVAQVALRQAWLLVEAGFRKGRELPLNKPVLTIGRAESCDIGMFGDAGIDKLHARILRQGNRYLIADADSTGGTYVNGQRIGDPTPLRSGDLIQLGSSLLRFRERQKRLV